METTDKTTITVQTTVNAPIDLIWAAWTKPEHITKWCTASEEWHTPAAENDLRAGGRFTSRMEAKDGSMGFDFGGTYTAVSQNEHIAYTMDDDRKTSISFKTDNGATMITETFEAENQNPIEMQRGGWQNILDNFKQYAESIA